ncbi:MAG: nucleoid-associated protein [Methylothermaceae bacteria B42]|nr:MAG: nucleoid-associated protein [Methylothermaceae bacteria B42]HHJ37846.1 YbaB/EbfC family nucleoid-associated protein [Methylothermaceae bacterium]
MMKNPLGALMQQAQEMQEKFQKAQEELARAEVQGEAGGGLVKVVMNGKREVLRLSIDDSLFKEEDKEILEDLVAAAVNDAVHKVAQLKQEKMSELTGGIQLPGGMNLPF